jgi:hypothetical protein
MIGTLSVPIRQDANGSSTRLRRSARRGLHHAGETTADYDPTSSGDETPDPASLIVEFAGGVAGTDDGDVNGALRGAHW